MNELMNAAVELMLLGMGTVFVFLVVLIFATRLMSFLVVRNVATHAGESTQPALAGAAPGTDVSQANPANDQRLIRVINEAIRQHRASGN